MVFTFVWNICQGSLLVFDAENGTFVEVAVYSFIGDFEGKRRWGRFVREGSVKRSWSIEILVSRSNSIGAVAILCKVIPGALGAYSHSYKFTCPSRKRPNARK